MKPFQGPEGQRGVSFEGSVEIGSLAAGLAMLIDRFDSEKPALQSRLEEVRVLHDAAKTSVALEAFMINRSRLSEVQNGGAPTDFTEMFDLDHPVFLEAARRGLEIAAQEHTDPIIRGVAEITHTELVQTLVEQGLIEPPEQQPPQE